MAKLRIGNINRIMLFAHDVPLLAAFYCEKLGLEPRGEVTPGWAELTAGPVDIALHGGFDKPASERGMCNAKLIFACDDVEGMRSQLVEAGVPMGDVASFPHETRDITIHICDGHDPEGNWFQISDRNLT